MDISKITNEQWQGSALVDRNGDKVGKVQDIYLDQETKVPEWALVNTGMFGTRESFVPLAGADWDGGTLKVNFEKAVIKDAPNAEPDGELSQEEEARLYKHYGLSYSEARSDTGLPSGGKGKAETKDTTEKRSTDSAMTRSEEEAHIGTARRPSELVRLKKYIVTEHVTQTVPVRREEVRIEREPITDANRDQAMSGQDLKEDAHEVTLMEEEVVTEKRVVPKERVRLDKDVVTEEEQVGVDVRKEQIEVEREAKQNKK